MAEPGTTEQVTPVAAPSASPAAWRAFLLVSGGVLLAWALHNALLLPWEVRHVRPALREPALVALRVVVWMVPIAVYLGRFDPRPRRVALGLTGHADPRGVLLGGLVGGAYLALMELLCRGFLLRQLFRHAGARKAQLVVAVLFMAMHLPGWIAQQGAGPQLVPMALVVFVLGLVLGFATRAAGSIYLSIALHLGHNFIAQWFSPD